MDLIWYIFTLSLIAEIESATLSNIHASESRFPGVDKIWTNMYKCIASTEELEWIYILNLCNQSGSN